MTTRMNLVPVMALVCLVAIVRAAAQWIEHPTPGIPRIADGKPNPDRARAADR